MKLCKRLTEIEGATIVADSGGIDVAFLGHVTARPIAPLLHALVEAAPALRSLHLEAADLSEDGAHPLQLAPLLKAHFPSLRALVVEANHEVPALKGPLLSRMPSLVLLALPCAPGPAFYAGEPHPLRALFVERGNDARGFVRQLGRSRRFPELEKLDFTDWDPLYPPFAWRPRRTQDARFAPPTPLADFLELAALPSLRRVVLRDAQLGADERIALRDRLPALLEFGFGPGELRPELAALLASLRPRRRPRESALQRRLS